MHLLWVTPKIYWLLDATPLISLVLAAFRQLYCACSVCALNEVQQKSVLRQLSKELECWTHAPLLSLPLPLSQRKSQKPGCSCQALSCVASERGWLGKVKFFFLPISLQLFSACGPLRDCSLLTRFWKSHKGFLVCVSFIVKAVFLKW